MGPAIFVIAIFGCGEAEGPCEHVATAPAQFESFADCTRATDEALTRTDAVNFPVVVAQCKQAGQPASFELRADEVDLPGAERQPLPLLVAGYDRASPKRH